MIYNLKFRDKLYRVTLDETDGHFEVEIDDAKSSVRLVQIEDNLYTLVTGNSTVPVGIAKKGKVLQVYLGGELYEIESVSLRDAERVSMGPAAGRQEIKSPMPSRIVKILKSEGEEVAEGEGVIVVEAMKMESELKSSINGKVAEVKVSEGDAVESGTVLVVITAEAE